MIAAIANSELGSSVRAKLNELILKAVTCVFSNTGTTSVSNTTTPTSTVPTGAGSNAIPANTLTAGSVIRIRTAGTADSDAVLGGGFFTHLLFGGVDISRDSSFDLSAADAQWSVEWTIHVLTIGAGGTCNISGRLTHWDGVGVWYDFLMGPSPSPSTIDTTAINTFITKQEWLTATAGDVWKTLQWRMEVSRF